jgi:cell division protein FtsL
VIAPKALPQEPRRSVERARSASKRRQRRAKTRGYSGFARVLGFVAVVAVPVLIYVMLTANLTSLNYSLARGEHEKAMLQEESMRLDDRIAHLSSRERLAALAAQMKMHDPHAYAIVQIPDLAPKPHPHGIAFLGAVNDWLRLP